MRCAERPGQALLGRTPTENYKDDRLSSGIRLSGDCGGAEAWPAAAMRASLV